MSVVKLLPKRFTWLAHAIERIIEYSKRYVWVFPPAIVLVAMLCVFKAGGLYPCGDKTVSWCDMDQQVVPLLLTFKDILAGKESFFATRESISPAMMHKDKVIKICSKTHTSFFKQPFMQSVAVAPNIIALSFGIYNSNPA